MRVLGIETATAWGSVALAGPEGVIGEHAAHVPGRHLEWLIPAIERLLADAGATRRSVEGIAVSIGPGGFSGLRTGLMTATAWAVTAGVRVVGVSTLHTLAAGARQDGLVLAVLDARRGEVAAALFRTTASPEAATRLTPDLLAPPERLRELLPVIDGPVLFAGDALERHREAVAAALAPWGRAAPTDQWWPRAGVAALLGRARLLVGDDDDPLRLAPRYVRSQVAGYSGL